MPIPDYETLMLPTLKAVSDGQEHRIRDIIDKLVDEFRLTDVERQQLLPSGKQATFANRVHWARTYLVQARLLEATKSGHVRITDRGRDALTKQPSRIDNEYLLQFPEFLEFRTRAREPEVRTPADEAPPNAPVLTTVASAETQTPDELLRTTVKTDRTCATEGTARPHTSRATSVF